MSVMTPAHTMFLQAFMAKGMLNGKEVKELHRSCCERFEGEVVITLVMNVIELSLFISYLLSLSYSFYLLHFLRWYLQIQHKDL